MDGINGISGLNGLVIGLAYALVANHEGLHSARALAVAIAGAGLGFLPFNFPTARVFLGDVGSYAIGGGIAGVAMAMGLAGLPVLVVIAPLSVYIADTGWTLVGRISRKEAWHTPHRLHIYQQLVDRGFSHTAVSLFVASLTAVISGLGAVSLTSNRAGEVAAGCAAAALLVGYLSAPRWLRRIPSAPPVSEVGRAGDGQVRRIG
jgi:UDP-N-acetylmuramyl pentapeptide phosphotransferase/UDP-N-acetylglucosamine-1-phosphate transferase